MKRLILSLLLVSVVATTFSQQQTTEIKDKQYYLDKSKSKKTTAWILLGAGTAAAIGGAIGVSENCCALFGDNETSDAYGFLFLGGVIADIASIPFFISSAHYKKIAAEITLGNQNTYLLKQNYFALNKIPVLIIRIHLR